MALLGLVVDRNPALHHFRQALAVQWRRHIEGEQFLGDVKQEAAIAIGHRGKGKAGIVIQWQGPFAEVSRPGTEVDQGRQGPASPAPEPGIAIPAPG